MNPPLTDPAGLFQRAPELAELAAIDASIGKAVSGGDPHAVYRALWWARVLRRLEERRATLDALLAQRALFVTPARRAPFLSTLNGVGASVYGRADRDTDGAYVKTHFLVLFFVPLFPLAQYLVKDAERGWFFLGKVPMSPAIRVWNRLVVAAVFVAILAGAFQAVHASRYHPVHVVNGLPWPVHVTIGTVPYDVPPNDRRAAEVHVGRHPVRATSASGRPIESGELQVEAGTDLLVWNVLGAAPVFERTVVYQSADGQAIVPDPHLFCGERLVRRSDVDDAFSDPPATVQMSKGQSVAYRRYVDVLPGGVEACARSMASERKQDAALALARGLALLDTDGRHTSMAVNLCLAAGQADEGRRLAEQGVSQHPDSVEHHRLYQSVFEREGKAEELTAKYKARFEADPSSPDAAYLYARVLPDAEALTLANAFVERFPDHVPLRRILIYRYLRERRFREALDSLEHVRARDRREWASFVDDHVLALAGLGRGDEASKLAEEAFARNEGSRLQLAGMHTWLSSGKGQAAGTLLGRLANGAATERLELEVRFWTAPASSNLAALASEPDRGVYQLMQHAHFQPTAALKDVPAARPDDLLQLDPEVLVLLLQEARRSRDGGALKRLEAAGERYLPMAAVNAYLDQGAWSKPLENLPLTMHGALHLARSRTEGLPAAERERLRTLAHDCDPVGGYVRIALAGWPAP